MAVKYIFVTGGVVSGIGKGITAASIGTLLKARGMKVTMQKLDPYINVDPGMMSPYQHGEVFVTEDGLEAELIKLPLREADIKRRFLGGKEEVEIDKQGRILVPQHLRSHAKLQKECVSIGVGDRVEIWDKSAWELKSAEFTSSSDTLLDRLDTLGI